MDNLILAMARPALFATQADCPPCRQGVLNDTGSFTGNLEIDYYNTLHAGLPLKAIRKLQHMPNAVARLGASRYMIMSPQFWSICTGCQYTSEPSANTDLQSPEWFGTMLPTGVSLPQIYHSFHLHLPVLYAMSGQFKGGPEVLN